MALPYARSGTRKTPQSEPIPGTNQVKNNAGGYVFPIDPLAHFRRFLILGSEGGSYYVNARDRMRESLAMLVAMFDGEQAIEAVGEIIDVSDRGRAVKNSPALFALAAATGSKHEKVRKMAFDSLPLIARTATHLFEFCEYRKAFGGWGKGMRRAVAKWYNSKDADALAYQMVKYRQREGWTHRDTLRLSHPKAPTPAHDALYAWACGKDVPGESLPRVVDDYRIASEKYLNAEGRMAYARSLPREALPTEWLNDARTWQGLDLDGRMPITALVRNLGKMTSVGYLKPLSVASESVCGRLRNKALLSKGRVHPISLLAAQKVYAQGKGHLGRLTWSPDPNIVGALDDAVMLAFDQIERMYARVCVGLDVSGSMEWRPISNTMPLTAAEAGAALACVLARMANAYVFGFSTQFAPLNIHAQTTVEQARQMAKRMTMGGTDCAVPMRHCLQQGIEVDVFVVITDNETWCGPMHPKQALDEYRRKVNPKAKLIVLATDSNNGFSIADPSDPGMLDIAGFDTSVPKIIEGFIGGEL